MHVERVYSGAKNITTIKKGFGHAEETPNPTWLSPANYGTSFLEDFGSINLAFRETRKGVSDLDNLVEELYLALYASHHGVGPPIYAATIRKMHELSTIEAEYYKLYIVMGAGYQSYRLFDNGESEDCSDELYEACQRASRAGLLLFDCKLQNTIYTVNDDATISKFYFIDFDPRTTSQLFEKRGSIVQSKADAALQRCLLFMNLMLLATHMRCYATKARATIDGLEGNLKHLTQSIREQVKSEQSAAHQSLCSHMLSVKIKAIAFKGNVKFDEYDKISGVTLDENRVITTTIRFPNSLTDVVVDVHTLDDTKYDVILQKDYMLMVKKYVFMLTYYIFFTGMNPRCNPYCFKWPWEIVWEKEAPNEVIANFKDDFDLVTSLQEFLGSV